MVIGTLALPYSLLDGSCYVSRAAAPKGGRSPVEYRGNLSIRTYVRPSERASIVTGKPELGSRRPELASRMLLLASKRHVSLGGLSWPLGSLSWPLGGLSWPLGDLI